MSEIETECTADPVCPGCGTPDPCWWDGLDGDKDDGDSWPRTCGECGRDYRVTIRTSYTFDTAIEEAKPR